MYSTHFQLLGFFGAILVTAQPLYLLDSSVYFFRSWFGVPDAFFDQEGRSVNGVYGYLRFLLTSIGRYRPTYMTAAFDESLFSGFRHSLYPEYKANRVLPDTALAYQLACCQQLTRALGITCLADPVYEADDLLVWAALTGRQQGLSCHFVTRDKDLAQAIDTINENSINSIIFKS